MNTRIKMALSALLIFMPERRIKVGRLLRIVEKLNLIRDAASTVGDGRVDLRDVILTVIEQEN